MIEHPSTSRLPVPSDTDYRNRIERAQAEMKKHGIDVLALAGIDIHRFFTGLNGLPVTRPIWLVLRQDGTAGFVSPRSEVKDKRERCRTPVTAQWVEWTKPVPAPMTAQNACPKHLI